MESRFVLSAKCILNDIAALLPVVERNPVAAGDLQEHVQALMNLVDATMPVGSQLDPFEPADPDVANYATPFALALIPPGE
jgi:hypothetical protein